MAIAGYSINTLTLFGMVLAIGLLVDDAIVVVENVERLIQQEGLSPKEAAPQVDGRDHRRAGRRRHGAGRGVPADGLLQRVDRRHLRQFSITIVSAMILSVLAALILTPALCATILKPQDNGRHKGKGPLAAFFRWFNDNFARGSHRYEQGVVTAARCWKRSFLVYALIFAGMVLLFWRLPSGFLPDEDQGSIIALVQGPSGATSVRTDKALEAGPRPISTSMRGQCRRRADRKRLLLLRTGQNLGLAFVPLKPGSDRPGAKNRAQAIAARAQADSRRSTTLWCSRSCRRRCRNWAMRPASTWQLVDTAGLGHDKLPRGAQHAARHGDG